MALLSNFISFDTGKVPYDGLHSGVVSQALAEEIVVSVALFEAGW